jgi:hypothetical protein
MYLVGKHRFRTIEQATKYCHDLFASKGIVVELRLETAEDKRRRRNAYARSRHAAYRDLGMVKTPYGYE